MNLTGYSKSFSNPEIHLKSCFNAKPVSDRKFHERPFLDHLKTNHIYILPYSINIRVHLLYTLLNCKPLEGRIYA